MSGIEYCTAGSFVYAAALHTHKPVFNHIDYADAVFAAYFIELFDDGHTVEFLAVDCGGNTLFKVNGYVCALVGRLPRRNAEFENFIVLRLVGGVFQIEALVRKVPQVFILGIVGLPGNFKRNVVRFRIVNFFVAALYVPYAPRGDYGHFGRKRLYRKFKTHLVVALARASVADCVGALFLGNFNNPLRDYGARERSTQKVLVLIHGARLHRGIDVIFDEFLAEVLYIQFGSTRFKRLFFKPFQLRLLSDVA